MSELQPTVFRDYMGGYAESEPMDSALSVMAYTEEDYEAWMNVISSPVGASEHSIVTLQNVSADPVPVRWLGNIVSAARTWEQLASAGVKTPETWKLLTPVHINTSCNDGDVEQALIQADKLRVFTHAYLDRFHPRVPKPELEVDDPAWVSRLMEHGELLHPHLPEYVKKKLGSMASKHNGGGSIEQRTTSYLLAHYEAYGRLDGVSFGGFEQRRSSIFIVPQSEDTFHDLMDSSEDSMGKIGVPTVRMATRNNILMVSSHLKSPHYYPHRGEALLKDMHSPERWPTRNQLSQGGINGIARDEITEVMQLIEDDIGGAMHKRELTSMVGDILNY